MNTVGFTTTVPLEILIAAQKTPVDLNNIFITDSQQKDLLKKAELDGFPRNICTWVKGIYAVVLQTGVSEVIAVTQGDCSNTQGLLETLAFKGIRTVPFFYPYDRDKELLAFSLNKLMHHYGVTDEQCLVAKTALDRIRRKVHTIDALTWCENTVSGFENHFYQVSTSDMNQNCHLFERDLDRFIASAEKRRPFREDIRLGYIGSRPFSVTSIPLLKPLRHGLFLTKHNASSACPTLPHPSSISTYGIPIPMIFLHALMIYRVRSTGEGLTV